MASIRAKVLAFEGGIDPDGRLHAGADSTPIAATDGWNAEALVLAAVARCSLSSLRFYARRAGATVGGSGHARGSVTAREEDGIYAFVDIEVDMDVTIAPPPDGEGVANLLRRAERGCFVGQSLRAKPRYRWRVNGQDVTPA